MIIESRLHTDPRHTEPGTRHRLQGRYATALALGAREDGLPDDARDPLPASVQEDTNVLFQLVQRMGLGSAGMVGRGGEQAPRRTVSQRHAVDGQHPQEQPGSASSSSHDGRELDSDVRQLHTPMKCLGDPGFLRPDRNDWQRERLLGD